MQSSTRSNHLRELQTMIGKFPLEMCCNLVTPEFGIPWREVSAAVRKSRLPMTPGSVSSVLTKYAAKNLSNEELQDFLTRLRLKSIVFHARTWHVMELKDKVRDEPINLLISSLPSRIQAALSQGAASNNKQYQVQTMKLQDLVFISVQLVTNGHQGSILYVASPPGQPVALVSSLHSNMMRACVYGLGYKQFEDAYLKGKDIPSLLRIYSGVEARMLTDMPEFEPTPRVCRGGIDYTNSQVTVSRLKKRGPETSVQFDLPDIEMTARGRGGIYYTNTQAAKEYVSQMLGPDPPVLDSLKVQMTMDFQCPDLLSKQMKMILNIKSENTLNILQKWAEVRAIQPTSELFSVCHTVRSNQIQMSPEDDE